MMMTALDTTRLEREWRAIWEGEGIDWRTAFLPWPRRVGQRICDGWTRVADACEVESFKREGRRDV